MVKKFIPIANSVSPQNRLFINWQVYTDRDTHTYTYVVCTLRTARLGRFYGPVIRQTTENP